MDTISLIPRVSLWAVYFGTFFLVILSIFLCYRISVYNAKRSAEREEGPIGSVVGSTLGLLAFMLAFTFGITPSRFDTRKQLLLDEVNAIGTAFLRTDFLVEPYRTEIRKLFRDYVDLRPKWVNEPEKLEELVAELEEIQDKIWSRAVEAVNHTPNQEITSIFIESLNDVIDFHTKRITVGIMYSIPTII